MLEYLISISFFSELNNFSNKMVIVICQQEDKYTIVEETIRHIKTLQQWLYFLENQILENPQAAVTLGFELSSTFHAMKHHHHEAPSFSY